MLLLKSKINLHNFHVNEYVVAVVCVIASLCVLAVALAVGGPHPGGFVIQDKHIRTEHLWFATHDLYFFLKEDSWVQVPSREIYFGYEVGDFYDGVYFVED
jgi:hypothetical protein